MSEFFNFDGFSLPKKEEPKVQLEPPAAYEKDPKDKQLEKVRNYRELSLIDGRVTGLVEQDNSERGDKEKK